MRLSLLTLGLLLSSAGLFAQTNMDQMVQERMAQRGGMRMEDDNDPFVPNTFIGSFRMEMHHVKDGVEQKEATDLFYWSSADKTLNQVKTP
ncbi:MAG TPA: hypothetical protein VHL57_12685, partial [Flavobacteriales bacterium]|nr:hypothetical protein [Flavobacteriales bacterium]